MPAMDKHKVKDVVTGLQKTLAIKAGEFQEQCPEQSKLISKNAQTLSKRLGKILDEEAWTKTKLLEMSTLAFLMAVATDGQVNEEEEKTDEAFEW